MEPNGYAMDSSIHLTWTNELHQHFVVVKKPYNIEMAFIYVMENNKP
jgi:hypothetical protein